LNSISNESRQYANLSDFNLNELGEWLSINGVGHFSEGGMKAFRGEQIFRWLGLGVRSFHDMTNIPMDLRARLASIAITGTPQIISVMQSARDGTVKYAMKTHDGNIIESVLMRYRHGDAICVSTQAGCRMGCTFCATKPGSFSRSLSPGEIFGQAAAIAAVALSTTQPAPPKPRVGSVVLMGIGEPFDNYDNAMKAIRLLHEHDSFNIGYRKFTISTCGIVPGILKLADEGLPIGLSVSLHAAGDRARAALMPVNNRYSIDKLIEGCKIYTYKTRRRVTFEYALIKDVNDAPDDAWELMRKIRGMLCHINLIPVNKTENAAFAPSSKERIARFEGILKRSGMQITVRRELGSDISAACGQLRNSMVD
jgi:23S rRNA (adenine2503-C2)-methyltransferase